jgi:hypothetical protein
LCPLAGKRKTVLEQTWRESCTCPGAENERPRRESAGVQARRAIGTERHEVFEAFRTRAAGQSRDQIKDLYKAEFRARGLDIPREEILDVYVRLLTG